MSVKTVVLDEFQIKELVGNGETISDGVSIVSEFQARKPKRLKELRVRLMTTMLSYHAETYSNNKIWEKYDELIGEIQKEEDQSLLKEIKRKKENGDTK